MKLLVTFLMAASEWIDQDPEMNLADLGPLQEPDPVAFHFDTIGWKILFACLVIFLGVLLFRQLRAYRQRAYRRDALRTLNGFQLGSQTAQAIILNASVLLKTVAIKSYGRTNVASLYGKEWLEFLDSKLSQKEFANKQALFQQAVYTQHSISDEELRDFLQSTKKWIHGHS